MAGEVERVIFLLQLEVVDRLIAKANSEHYGALSVFVQAAFEVERALVIRRGAFYPQPEVDSAVVLLEAARFARRGDDGVPRARARRVSEAAQEAAQRLGKRVRRRSRDSSPPEPSAPAIDLDARGETLAVADFARMAAEFER